MSSPIPPLPTFADGKIVTAADLNALSANVAGLYQAAFGVPSAQAYLTTKKPQVSVRVTVRNRSIPYSALGIVNWDTADINSDNMWVSSAPSTITVRTAGTYRISTQVGSTGQFKSGAGVQLVIFVNGTDVAANAVGCWRDDYSSVARASATMSLFPNSIIQVGVRYGLSGYYYLVDAGGCRLDAIRIAPA